MQYAMANQRLTRLKRTTLARETTYHLELGRGLAHSSSFRLWLRF